MRHLLLIAVVVTNARAETRVAVTWGESEPRDEPALIRLHGVEDGAVEHASLAITSDATSTRATLTLSLTTKHADARDLRLPLEVSAGTRMTGLAVAIGTLAPLSGKLIAAEAALHRYEQIVAEARDPALLRWVRGDQRRVRYELAAFPVARGAAARLTIGMTLPSDTRVVVFDPGPHAVAGRKVVVARAERASWMETDTAQRSAVDPERSLYAGFVPAEAPRVERRHAPLPRVGGLSITRERELRERLHTRQQALHCYAYGRELEPTLLPFVELAITIDAAGDVSAAELAGDMDNGVVRACIADEVKGWQFRAAEHKRVLRTSIDLRFAP